MIKQKKNFWIDFLISSFLGSLLLVLLKDSNIFFGGLLSMLFLVAFYFLIKKIRASDKGREILYNFLVSLLVFPFLAVSIGNIFSTENQAVDLFLMFLLFICSYFIAKYILNLLKERRKKV